MRCTRLPSPIYRLSGSDFLLDGAIRQAVTDPAVWQEQKAWASEDQMFDEIAAGLAKHKLVPFFGAGASASHLHVLWKDLSDEMADAIKLPADQRDDFLKVADEFVAAKGETALAELLRLRLIVSDFDDVKGWSHLFLLSLNSGVLYTTNQDNLFELASKKKGRPHRVIARLEDLAESNPGERFLIKYHGDLEHPETVIFSGKSYNDRIANVRHFLNIRMQGDLLAKGFFFVGYSFQDPNVHMLFRELRAAFGPVLPPSYLVAYRYDPAMEELNREFGVNIVDPMAKYPDAASHDEAFKRYLKALSERVLQLKSSNEVSSWLAPSTPPSIRIATEFDVATVLTSVRSGSFVEGLKTYRSLLDRTMIPDGLEKDALEAFKQVCDGARTNDDLAALAAAVFNLSLPGGEALQAISRLMVAVNRVNYTQTFPDYMIISPRHGDEILPAAASLAVIDIKRVGDTVNDAFRRQADAWLISYPKLPPEIQEKVRYAMEIAWRDCGSQPPAHLYKREGMFAAKTFSEINSEYQRILPQMLGRAPS